MADIIVVLARSHERAVALQNDPRSFFTAMPSWRTCHHLGAWVCPPEGAHHGYGPSSILGWRSARIVAWDLLVDDYANRYAHVIPDKPTDTVIKLLEGALTFKPAERALGANAADLYQPIAREAFRERIIPEYIAPTLKKVSGLHETHRILVSAEMFTLVKEIARAQGLDPALALAVAEEESGFDPRAVSETGAIGIMQLMPSTARDLGVTNPFDPRQNIAAGIALLKLYFSRYATREEALTAYRSGRHNLALHGVTQHDHEYAERVRVRYWKYTHTLEDAIISEGP